MTNGNQSLSRNLEEVAISIDHRVIRRDRQGSGDFGAPRGSRVHRGVDLEFEVGEEVEAPASGMVVNLGYCYNDDLSFRYVEILSHNRKFICKLLYVKPAVRRGIFVNKGDVIGVAQDIAGRYGGGMVNHVHLEVLVDPMLLKGGSREEGVGSFDSDDGARTA